MDYGEKPGSVFAVVQTHIDPQPVGQCPDDIKHCRLVARVCSARRRFGRRWDGWHAGEGLRSRSVPTTPSFTSVDPAAVWMTPWDKLVAALTPANITVIVSTVTTFKAKGFLVGRRLGMYPIESAIVNVCHNGQGGTGDVAILTAANRMQLMAFAQIATRIGGAITVTLTLILLARLG